MSAVEVVGVDADDTLWHNETLFSVTHQRFANPAAIPFHSRWRHFEAGGHDRWRALAKRLTGLPKEEVARRRVDQNAGIPLLTDWIAVKLVNA